MIACIKSLVLLSALFTLSRAIVPSLGLSTVEAERSGIEDSGFLIRFPDTTVSNLPTFTASSATLANTPALAGADVQATVVQLEIPAGSLMGLHYHPRNREIIYVRTGTIEARFRFEGGPDARLVTSAVEVGEAFIVPEGLVHEFLCVSDDDCISVSMFNSADAGVIFV